MLRPVLPALAAAFLSFGAAQAATVSIDTDAGTVEVGDSFEVTLRFEADDASEILTAFDSDVTFDSSLVSLEGVSFIDPATGINQLMLPGGVFVPSFTFNDFVEGVQVFGFTSNTDDRLFADQADGFVFASLLFTAVGTGTADIGLGLFQDFFGADFALLDVAFGTEIVSVDVVPLPGAVVFMLTGLAGVAARRRLA